MMKRLFRCLLVIVIIHFCLPVSAQEEIFFSTDSQKFIEQVDSLLNQTNNKLNLEKAQILMTKLRDPWIQGRFNKEEKDYIKAIAEKMQERKLPVYPDLYNYLVVIQLLTDSKQPASSTLKWFSFAFDMIQGNSLKPFNEVLAFTERFLLADELKSKSGVFWASRNSQYRFDVDSSLLIRFEKLDLVCSSQRDSSVIRKTSGVFKYQTCSWTGKEGKVDWWRFGYEQDEFCARLGNYTINMNLSEYTADSVVFENKKLFSDRLLGRFSDKVLSNKPNQRSNYPRFSTYFDDYEINDIFPGIGFNGRISIEGGTVFGQGSENKNATLTYHVKNEIVAVIYSKSFIIGSDKLTSVNAKAKFLIKGDSIYHPELKMRFSNDTRMLLLYRSDEGVGEAPFSDSYHKVDLYFETLNWNIDTEELTFSKLEGVSQESKGWIESQNYFSNREYQILKGIDDYHPMVLIDNYLKTFGYKNTLQLNAFSDYINMPSEQVLTQFLRLASKGFMVYDVESQTGTVTDKFFNVLSARAGKTDYDVIKLQSVTTKRIPNISYDFKTKNLNINGVVKVILSDTQNVVIQPNNDLIVMKKNRDFAFSGVVQAGLFKFYAYDCSFEYDKFQLNFAYIDSISFLVKSREITENNEKQRYVKVRNVLANLTGNLLIDDPANKSGLKKFSHFPVFESKGESYVYFDNKQTQDGLLKKEKFYYAVEPFIIDSLMTFSTDELKFEGYLASAGIFPVFREPLIVMEDYSLGFNHVTTPIGYGMYENKANFFDFIHLSNKGFFGNGRIEYLTSVIKSDTFKLYPDSVLSLVNEFVMNEKNTTVEFPRGQADSVAFRWLADTNIVQLTTLEKPYIAYNNAIVRGLVNVSPDGMHGRGTISFSNAEIESRMIRFLSQSFYADTANFQLFTTEGKLIAFEALGYQAVIDFEARTGNFKSIGSNCQLSFPFNQYICTLDEANWLMDLDKLKLNNNKIQKRYDLDNMKIDQIIDLDLSGSNFVSTHPLQDSLSFFCLAADYDLVNYTINAQNVKIIRVADAAIFPNDGLVTIEKGANMETLESATIITDLESRYHQITDAEVTIESRQNFNATGKYKVIIPDGKVHEILFHTITVGPDGHTMATAMIYENNPISFGKYFDVIGQVGMISTRKHFQYTGGFRINESCHAGLNPYVGFDTIIDPFNVRIPVSKPTDMKGIPLQCGFYWDGSTDSYHGSFLRYPHSDLDIPVFEQSGVLFYENSSSSFKIDEYVQKQRPQLLSLKTKRCFLSGNGKLDFDIDMHFVDIQTYGDMNYHMIPDSTSLNLFLTLDFSFDQKVMSVMSDSLNAVNLKAINLSEGNYVGAISQLISDEEAEKVISDISNYGYYRRLPQTLQKSIVISNVKMVFNRETNTFVSEGQIGISNLYDVSVNKYVNGYIELEKGKTSGSFKIYLQPTNQQWYYFDYKSGVLQAISSSGQFNNELMSIKQEKRIKMDTETGEQYEYVISTRRKAIEFLRTMQPENE